MDAAQPDEYEPHFETLYNANGNAAKFLRAFQALSHLDRWKEIAFDEQTLKWISNVWAEAAIAAAGNTRVREACVAERDRYLALRKGLVAGMMDRQDIGVVYLNDLSDWPHPKVLASAIRALEYAQIGRLQ